MPFDAQPTPSMQAPALPAQVQLVTMLAQNLSLAWMESERLAAQVDELKVQNAALGEQLKAVARHDEEIPNERRKQPLILHPAEKAS
jgi:hypothetical protein